MPLPIIGIVVLSIFGLMYVSAMSYIGVDIYCLETGKRSPGGRSDSFSKNGPGGR